MTKIWVLMGNDYPAAAFDDEAKADANRGKLRKQSKEEDVRRIYWRIYEFELNKESSG